MSSNTGPPIGRPKAHIDIATVERSAAIGCTPAEIAAILGIGRQTLYDRLKLEPEIQEALDRGREQGRTTLRRLQWEQAQAGNPTMLIWLGKQMLGQRDKQEISGEVANDIRVRIELVGNAPNPHPGPQIEGGATYSREGERSPAVPALPWERN